MDTLKIFFPFYFLGSPHNSELRNRLLFLWPSLSQLSTALFPGDQGLPVTMWVFGGKWSGSGNREVDTRGLVRQTAVCWVFRTEKQLAGGTWGEEKSKGRKKYTSLFIAISPIGRTFCWGGCLPRTSNSVCSTHFIFKPECRFYSWDVTGPVWAGMGKLTSEIFTSWKGPSESLPVNFRADLHFLSVQWNATLGWQRRAWLKSGRLWEVTPLSGIIVYTHTLPLLKPTLEFWLKTKSQIPQV